MKLFSVLALAGVAQASNTTLTGGSFASTQAAENARLTGNITASRPGPAFPIVWPCPAAATPAAATSVHALRPGNVQVIAALGDSITAGFGAEAQNLLQLTTEWKGVSWTVGAVSFARTARLLFVLPILLPFRIQPHSHTYPINTASFHTQDKAVESTFTLANALLKYNPKLIGGSTGTGNSNPQGNFAVSGGRVRNMLADARKMQAWMSSNPDIDYQNDWKVRWITARSAESEAMQSLVTRCSLVSIYSLATHSGTHRQEAILKN